MENKRGPKKNPVELHTIYKKKKNGCHKWIQIAEDWTDSS